MLDIAARRADFHALHKEGYFLLPTAWDVGGAKQLDALGFAGLASSNSGLARALGRDCGHVTRDEMLAYLRQLVNAAEIAVNADFESGLASGAMELIANLRLAIDTGMLLCRSRTASATSSTICNRRSRAFRRPGMQ